MTLLKSSFTVSSWTMVSRILGFLRDVALANKLGTSAVTDAFFVALVLPNLLRRLFAEGAFNVAFVPLFSQMYEKNPAQAQAFTNTVFTWLVIVLGVITLLAEIFMPTVVSLLVWGFRDSPEKLATTVFLARITFPYLMLISLASLMGSLCNSMGRFAAYAAVPALLNISLLAGLFLLPPFGIPPVMAATIAIPLGGLAQIGFMGLALRKTDLRLRFVRPAAPQPVKNLLYRLGPAALGVGVLQISFLIDVHLASYLYDEAISYLQYANRFYQLPLALIGTALATVLLPHLAKAIGRSDQQTANKNLKQALIGGIALALAATAGLVVLAEELMATLLQHGEFDAAASQATAWAMIGYSLGLPGYILTKITATGFFAAGDTKTPVKTSALALLVNLVANLILMQIWGHIGIALATALSGWTNAGLQWYLLRRSGIFSIDFQSITGKLFKALLLSLGLALLLVGYEALIPYGSIFIFKFMWLTGAIGLGFTFFIGGAAAVGLVEKKLIYRLLKIHKA
jgi:putative peptidoglycan lipid II flippase